MKLAKQHVLPLVIGCCVAPVIVHFARNSNVHYAIASSKLPFSYISPTPTLTNTPYPTTTPHPTVTSTPKPTKVPLPTQTPYPTQIPVTSEQLDRWFTQYANHYSIERQKLLKMAVCESNLKPNAKNGDYIGLYQFSTNTWKSTRRSMNVDSNPELRFNPEESIKTAAFKISTMGLSPWPNCAK